ncbi:MAG: methyltransferase domain-containing protein [Actinomycetota bacterium]|nr:methyltransferase domain-containing protein [Actinomycetota bacterium]
MARVVVTVGMGRWPFDRLVEAAGHLATGQGHDVFVQTGTSSVEPRCAHAAFVPPSELRARMAAADVVVTHAGNSVRLVQRMGRVPIAVGRRADRGEMGNDHQLRYIATEIAAGRVVAVQDPASELATAVAGHAATEARLLAERSGPPSPPEPDDLARLLDRIHELDAAPKEAAGPFAGHPTRRYAWAWSRLADRTGPHLDVGCADGRFAGPFADAQPHRLVVGVDPDHRALVRAQGRDCPLRLASIGIDDRLPFRRDSFGSASVLDALEHVPDERRLLSELHRVLRPDAVLLVTVPRRHLLSTLDPDNAKFRTPRLHRAVYRRRFGEAVYHERFVDQSDGLVGDMSLGRHEHTNYRQAELVASLTAAGFTPIEVDGANRWWRVFHPPALLGGPRLRAWCERRILNDGLRHHDANLFCAAVRS